ncbi:sodium-dependent glucose transporter 1-like [Bradysia coprophila]|uniref:sodium-dependent glucose transporter 1-like n=1 Tax=Bradysia coprophila TaxID=38358 RepID=UPI00187D9FEE|nr:sodium-dependent glucose transporter 1-like [Bradysia coprophila]
MLRDIKHVNRKKPQPLSKRVMYLTTSAILFGNISFGCSITSLAPALDNIARRYKTSIEDISIVFTLLTMMYCIGAIMCGVLSRYVNRQLMVVLSLSVIASSMFLTPHCPSKNLFCVLVGVFGFASGFYGSSQVVWIIEIWQQKSGPFIQAQHFAFSVGSIIPSVVLAPFLHQKNHSPASATESAVREQSMIQTPFLIIGTLNSLSFLYQLFLYIFYRYHKPPMYADVNFEPADKVENNQPLAEGDLSESNELKKQEEEADSVKVKTGISNRKIRLVAFAMLFLGAYQAMEISTMQFLPIFGQHSDLKLSESAAAHVLSGLMITYASGRLLGIFIILKVRPDLIIVANVILIATGNTILLIWASGSLIMFWIGSLILGAGFANMYPSFFTFIEKHLIISGNIASCVLVFGTTTSAMYPIILGKIIEHHAVVLSYTNFASIVVCIVAICWGYNLTRKTLTRE